MKIARIMIAAVAMGAIASAAFAERNVYLEVADQDQYRTVITTEDTGGAIAVTSMNDDAQFYATLDRVGDTKKWQSVEKGSGTDYTATREGNVIRVRGSHGGKAVSKDLSIDDAPWFQFMEISLKDFVKNGETQKEFWILQPGAFKAYKVIAIREGTESLSLSGSLYSAQRVKVTLKGLLSAFWSCNFWYDPNDGKFLQFKGKQEKTDVVISILKE